MGNVITNFFNRKKVEKIRKFIEYIKKNKEDIESITLIDDQYNLDELDDLFVHNNKLYAKSKDDGISYEVRKNDTIWVKFKDGIEIEFIVK